MELIVDTVAVSIADSIQSKQYDAIVTEQDTFMLLGVDTVLKEPAEDIRELALEIEQQEPLTLGDVVVNGHHPLQLAVIIYDIEQDPVCRKPWIKSALHKLLIIAADRELNTIGMPLLGASHGQIAPYVFLNLLRETLRENPQDHPKQIILTGLDQSLVTALVEFDSEPGSTSTLLH